jgi:hypothetical protein
VKPEDAIIEARAKVAWGESNESVQAFLQANGFSESHAVFVLDEFRQERATGVRSAGIRKIRVGASLTMVPEIAFVIFARAARRATWEVYPRDAVLSP